VGSTQCQAGGRGRIRFACLSILAIAGLLVVSAPALAGTVTNERPLLFTFDGSDADAGKFTEPVTVDIDQVTGNVYLVDSAKDVLDKFDANGGAVDFFDTGSSSVGISAEGSSDISVDNSGGANQGRIHTTTGSAVNAFSGGGSLLWTLGPFTPPLCGVAIDTEGHVWAGHYSTAKALEFANTGSPPVQIGSVSSTSGSFCHLNLDAGNNLYIVRYENSVDKYVGGIKTSTLDPSSTYDIAIDQSSPTGHLFTIHSGNFNEYDSTGALIKTFGTNLIGQARGIAYNQSLDRVYVSDQASDTVKVFGPIASGTVPDVTSEAASEITLHAGKFNAKINPLSLPNAYHFEWKEGEGASWATAQSSPSQSIEPTDGVQHAVSFDATGLKSNTKYQFRLVGTNTENGLNAYSSPTTFTTLTPPPPAVTIDVPASVTTTTADISGTVNPQGDATTWRIQLSNDPACASGFTNLAANNLGSEGTSPVPVSEELTGLLPNRHYCVRISATNPGGTTNSESKELTTLPVIPSQVSTAFVAPRSDTSARLNGYVNPNGGSAAYPLTYRFEYSDDGGATWTVLPDQEYEREAREQIVVSHELGGLEPATTYSYRFSAENSAGPAVPQGEARTFTTRTTAEMNPPARGIELVSNPDKGTQNALAWGPFDEMPPLSPDGNRALWTVLAGAPGANSGTGAYFLARRTADGWRSKSIVPAPDKQIGGGDFIYRLETITRDLTHFVSVAAETDVFLQDGQTVVRLDENINQDALRDIDGTVGDGAGLEADVSVNGAHVVFPNPDTDALEGIGAGPPELISIMPDGSPASCQINSFMRSNQGPAGANFRPGYHRIAAEDASRVYFQIRPNGSCGSGPEGLYVRNRDTDLTTLIDPGTGGQNPRIIRATPDGGQAYFDTVSQLDPDDENLTRDVYRWDENVGASICVTCEATAEVSVRTDSNSQVLVSDDFSHIYFESEKQLVAGRGANGRANIYALSGEEIHFVGDPSVLGANAVLSGASLSQLSADGNVLTYVAPAGPGLTSDEIAAECFHPLSKTFDDCRELYRYDDRDGSTECLSCLKGGLTTHHVGTPANINVPVDFQSSANGSTTAFITAQRLLSKDVNNDSDIYVWRNGTLRLITDGVSDFQEQFAAPQVTAIDATGANVLFSVVQPGLTGFENDGLANIYVARLGGGFTPPSPRVPCSEDSCQGPLQPAPGQAPPSSSSYRGYGNLGSAPVACRPGKARRRGRCVSKRALARRACRNKQGAAKRRCVRGQMSRLSRMQRGQLREETAQNDMRSAK
jgi:hypothetical protein